MTLTRSVVLSVSHCCLSMSNVYANNYVFLNTGWSHQTVENLLENSDDVVIHLR